MSTSHQHPHLGHDHVAAVFPQREAAEAAVEALRTHGFGSESLGVAIHGDEPIQFERDSDEAMGRDIGIGVASGVPVGAFAGFALAALATGLGVVISVGGILAVAGAMGWGGLIGSYLGVAAGVEDREEHEKIAHQPLARGEVLVAVCSHGRPDVVTSIMEESGARMVALDQSSS